MQIFKILGQISVNCYSPMNILQLWNTFQGYIKKQTAHFVPRVGSIAQKAFPVQGLNKPEAFQSILEQGEDVLPFPFFF